MEKSVLQPYKNELNPSSSRRIEAHLIDALLLVIVSFILLIFTHLGLSNASFYKDKENMLTQEMVKCYEIEEEAKIYFFDNNENHLYQNPRDQEEIFKEYCYKHLLYSFNMNSDEFVKNGISIDNPNNYLPASYEEDNLAYFYVNYVDKYNENNDILNLNNLNVKQYYYEVLKKNTYNPLDNSSMWIYDEENYSLPYLNPQHAIDLYKYFQNNEYQAGKSIRNLLASSYQKIWNEEVSLLVNSSRFKNHYEIYKENYAQCSYILDGFVCLSYVVSFALVVLLPQFFFKNMKTIGKKVMQICIADNEGYQVTTKQFIFRNLCSFILFFGIMIVSCFFSGGLQTGWMYPIFEIGGAGISLFSFMAISAIMAFVSFILIFVNKQKKSIQDILCGTKGVDERYIIEERKQEISEEVIENKYLDSSTFSNPERVDLTKKD